MESSQRPIDAIEAVPNSRVGSVARHGSSLKQSCVLPRSIQMIRDMKDNASFNQYGSCSACVGFTDLV